MTLIPGQMLSHYRLVERIGQGGMGEVWKAVDTKLDREVAIKVLPEPLAREPLLLRRFEREAKVIAALSHPNIVAIYGFGTDAGVSYAVTELLEGETLWARLTRGPLPAKAAVELSRQIALGLAAAHQKGITHRDLKPENVFLTVEGRVKILDFGLAKRAPLPEGDDLTTLTRDTQAGTVMGTVGYMSPEQLRGREADPRSDVFAFGVTLYEMLSGRQPFAGKAPADIITAVLREEPEPLSALVGNLPPVLEEVVRRCLVKEPDRRLASGNELASLLQPISEQESVRSSAVSPRRPADPQSPSIAVLPFTDMSPARDQEYFCEGMAEEIINALTRIEGLRVAARTSTFQFNKKTQDIRRLGEGLKVSKVLEGSVRTAGDRLRITASLVNVANGFDIWSARYDRESKDVFAIQDEIARSVANALEVELVGPPAEARPELGTRNLEAYHFYLKGRYYRYTKEDFEQALPCFGQAVALNPTHVLSRAGLAEIYILRCLYGSISPREAYSRAREEIDAAIELQWDSSEALAVDALLRLYHDLNWSRAEHGFGRSIELNPENVHAHAWYGVLLSILNRSREALAAVRKAKEIDPLSPYTNAMVGLVLLNGGQVEEAITEYEKAREIDPDNVLALWGLGVALVTRGRLDPGIDALQRAAQLSGRAMFYLGLYGWSFAVAKRTLEARKILEECEARAPSEYPTFGMIWLLSELGETERAWELIRRAEEEGQPLAVDLNLPGYDRLRADPRFGELRRRLNLPP